MFFIPDYGNAFSARSPPFSSFALPIFSAFFTYAYMDPAYFLKFLPVGFQPAVSRTT